MATTPLCVPSTRLVEWMRRVMPQHVSGMRGAFGFTEKEIAVEHVEALLAPDDAGDQVPVPIPSDAWRQFDTALGSGQMGALGNGVVWLGSEILVGRFELGGTVDYPTRFLIKTDDSEVPIYVWVSRTAGQDDAALGFSLLFRLLETSGITQLKLTQWANTEHLPSVLPGPVLSRFLTRTASLEKYTGYACRFCEPQIRALDEASVQRP